MQDNGGQAKWPNAAGANMPLRGGKYSPWEGGVRVAAFVSGGLLPPSVRGTKQTGLIHGCDWGLARQHSVRVLRRAFQQQAGVGRYATFAALAQQDPTDHAAASAGLPPVDGEAATLS